MDRFNSKKRERIEVILEKKKFIAARALEMKNNAKDLIEAMIPKAVYRLDKVYNNIC